MLLLQKGRVPELASGGLLVLVLLKTEIATYVLGQKPNSAVEH